MKNSELLNDMLKKQLKNIPHDKKLKYDDLKRLCKYVNGNIFDETNCCLWTGYITNINNESKGIYINFYFRGKKAALHRLLYINFVGNLTDDEYLKFSCDNKGKCCDIAHLNKFRYVKKENQEHNSNIITPNKINTITDTNPNKNTFTLSFD